MKEWMPAPAARAARPSMLEVVFDWVKRAIDAFLNRVFSLTHRVSVIRWNALGVGFILAWLVSMVLTVPEEVARRQLGDMLSALALASRGDTQSLLFALLDFTVTVVLHPAVIKHLLALFAPFWLMHRITAIYLADIFEESEVTARQFVMEAAFGQGYTTLHIRNGKVVEDDHDSTIIRIGGPGYVQVDLDSAVLFERPDGTPHVIGPTGKEIIDDFERIRRVFDLRDSVDTVELPPTRSRDGIIVGAKDIQFSYSIHRGESPNRSATPYPFSPAAVESLVYKDTRVVKPGIAPARKPEWQSDPFKMGGPIMAEMGTFISKRGLSEFLAAIGEPEENSLTTREQKIDQFSQLLSGINGDQAGNPPLKAPDFSSRTFLTDLFYSQDGFQKRMADKGFKLNWIGVGTWYTPAEIIPANHRDAWKTSRENFTRGNPQALETLQSEAKLQELLRLIQILPINKFYNDLEKVDDERLLDNLLQEYEETLQRAADLYGRGRNGLDLRFTRLTQEAARLFERLRRPPSSMYDDFLQYLALMSPTPRSIYSSDVEELLSQAAGLYEDLNPILEAEDRELLRQAVRLYQDLRAFYQIVNVISSISRVRQQHHQV